MAILAGITAAAALAGAGASAYGVASSNQNAALARQQSGQAAAQTAANNDQYQKLLNAIAMKRSVAGTVDAQGNTMTYDPTTNTWRTVLGPSGQRVQSAVDNANVSRNTTDLRTGQQANENEMMASIMAQRAADPALRQLQNFRPMTSQDLEGKLQQRALAANRSVQDPMVADTLRTFARTGTAAGPVMEQMQREGAEQLRKTVLDSSIAAMTNTDQINNQRRAGLTDAYTALRGASKPSLSFSPIATDNPNTALTQLMSSRAAGAATPASQASYSTTAGTNASTAANQLASNTVADSNPTSTALMSLGGQAKNIGGDLKDLYKALFQSNSPSGGSTGNSTGFGSDVNFKQPQFTNSWTSD